MATLVTVDDVVARLDTLPDPASYERIGLLITDAEELVRDAFDREGRSFEQESIVSWVGNAARRVIREMVSAAIIIGPNAGVRSATSTTGQESDSLTYDRTDMVSFSGVRLTDEQRRELGLSVSARAQGRFPDALIWPEVYRD